MKTTRYFDEVSRLKHPEIDPAWCPAVLAAPLHTAAQANGLIRHWGEVTIPGEAEPRILRVVTRADGETVVTAFIDGGFPRRQGRAP